MQNRILKIELSASAELELRRRSSPLEVELELYFSCLIRLRVNFNISRRDGSIPISSNNQNVKLYFHPIMTQTCHISEVAKDAAPPVVPFPIKTPERFIPHWLKLDYKNNVWQGEFGYT